MLVEIYIGYLLVKKEISLGKSIILSIASGVSISAVAAVIIHLTLDRGPTESFIQFIVGCFLSPTLILICRQIYNMIASRKKNINNAIQEDLQREEADYTAAIQALLIKHEKVLGRQYLIDNDMRERLGQESTDILIDRINSHYFSDDALPAVLQILKSRMITTNRMEH